MGLMDMNLESPAASFSQSTTVRFLETLPLFEDLDGEAIGRLARGASQVPQPQGSVIFQQGDTPAALHIILSGQIKLSLQTARGDEKVIELLGRGACFGAVPLFLGERYALTAETIQDSMLAHLSKNAVLDEVERNPAFSARMLREVCLRLQERTRYFENCMLLNGPQRVTTFLLSQIPNGVNGESIAVTLPAKKGTIASRLNLTHEHFSRILHEIQAAGLIEVRGREIQVLNVARLRAYAA
jgi:CRP/FNR family transcriptional regulator, dissimilatory nitrate respiration regulator